MKKTIQTLMTAAMFAVAMGNIPSGTAQFANASDYNPATEDVQDVYGPPVVQTTVTTAQTTQTTYQPTGTKLTDATIATTETTFTAVYSAPSTLPYESTNTTTDTTTQTTDRQTDTQTTEDVIATTEWHFTGVYSAPSTLPYESSTKPTTSTFKPSTTVPVPVYGPPISWLGDINRDNRIDVFDMIELRQAYINGEYDYNADVNMDGEIGVADMVMLQNYLLGKIDSFYEPIFEPQPTTTAPQFSYVNTQQATETTVTEPPVTQPVYGAPIAFE
ncbi:MAG: dockerin type I repeat-containing protein [Ruminococcus flavefaciens]|nr:dockerin type I repeat-containing protein [Ruminococcus flavefaciens]MCM1229361.1 dockerin type I repeat-containing protein [Ruminococcus flavefaciens]